MALLLYLPRAQPATARRGFLFVLFRSRACAARNRSGRAPTASTVADNWALGGRNRVRLSSDIVSPRCPHRCACGDRTTQGGREPVVDCRTPPGTGANPTNLEL
ncbi:hypothetical protein K466DRAFT_580203 [Polyporus arcularius HHB13444]|uniref:Uncharacterized protein n=1 Tax=Polyporus arcularius HHB13444 TaxID=1314778 RepID=A0A5C3PZJ3_9APHY|nr:hypothetical protein K466DRAFT_580203 [Polyporus arcularius HHB13444]